MIVDPEAPTLHIDQKARLHRKNNPPRKRRRRYETAATRPPRPLPKPSSGGRPGWIGAYSPEARKRRIARFHGKRARRVWTKRVKYDVRKDFASTRPRVEGRFAKKEEEDLLKLIGALDGAISPRTI